MEISDKQKEQNYEFLVEALKRLRAGTPPTEDMEQLDWQYFKGMRRVIGNFNEIHPEIKDPMFRAKANDMEQLARYLDMYTDETGHIHYPSYLQFLERVNYVTDVFYALVENPFDMDGLTSAFKKQTIK